MNHLLSVKFPLCALLCSWLFLAACGPEDPSGEGGSGGANPSGGATPTGGAATGGSASGGLSSGGANTGGVGAGGAGTGGVATGGSATGGAPGGAPSGGNGGASGGVGPGTGGEVNGGTGGGNPVFSCPQGAEALVPSLQGKTATKIDGVPEVQSGGFLEGPAWYSGKLFLSQITFTTPQSGDLLVYTPGGGFAPFLEDVGTNGLAIDASGTLYAASQKSAGVVAFDADDAMAPPVDVARMYDGKAFNSPNDLTVSSTGTVYFSDPSHNCGDNCAQGTLHGVYRVPPGGQPELLMTTQDQPNGISLSPDESILYVGGTALTAHPVLPDGSIGEGQPFGDVTSGTDGLAVDCAGNVYVAEHSLGQLVIFDAAGTRLPGSLSFAQITNVAFGGAENKTLYVTAFGDNRGTLHSVEMEVPGYPF